MKKRFIPMLLSAALLLQQIPVCAEIVSDVVVEPLAEATTQAIHTPDADGDILAVISDIMFTGDTFTVPEGLFITPAMQRHLVRLNKNLESDITLSIGGRQISLTKQTIADMTDINTGAIDYNKLYSWCKYIYDSYGSATTFRSWNGAIITIPKGDYTVKETFTIQDIITKVYPALLSFSDLTLELSPTLGNDYIECDLTNQKIYWYQGGQCVLSSNCVTGKKSTPTPTGIYSIKNILGRTRLKGESNGSEWDVYVNHWSLFHNGCGLHDASWQSFFGLARWQAGYGSHGCINLPPYIADKMGEFMTCGEPIIIYNR